MTVDEIKDLLNEKIWECDNEKEEEQVALLEEILFKIDCSQGVYDKYEKVRATPKGMKALTEGYEFYVMSDDQVVLRGLHAMTGDPINLMYRDWNFTRNILKK